MYGMQSCVYESGAKRRGEAEGMRVEEGVCQTSRGGRHAEDVKSITSPTMRTTYVNDAPAICEATIYFWTSSRRMKLENVKPLPILGDYRARTHPCGSSLNKLDILQHPDAHSHPRLRPLHPCQLRSMASIASACRLSARAASQQLRSYGTRRGRKQQLGSLETD